MTSDQKRKKKINALKAHVLYYKRIPSEHLFIWSLLTNLILVLFFKMAHLVPKLGDHKKMYKNRFKKNLTLLHIERCTGQSSPQERTYFPVAESDSIQLLTSWSSSAVQPRSIRSQSGPTNEDGR